MLTFKHIGAAAIASIFVVAMAVDSADARRGGGGGGARAGGMGGGGAAMRAGGAGRAGLANPGSRRAQVSQPIARPGIGNRPGGGGEWAGNRPGGGAGWAGNRPGWDNRPGWGWGAAAVGAGIAASSYYGDGYSGYGYGDGYYGGYTEAANTSDAVAYCAQRFRSYDVASQTYLARNGRRVSCP
jgi:hypothetical protein